MFCFSFDRRLTLCSPRKSDLHFHRASFHRLCLSSEQKRVNPDRVEIVLVVNRILTFFPVADAFCPFRFQATAQCFSSRSFAFSVVGRKSNINRRHRHILHSLKGHSLSSHLADASSFCRQRYVF